MLRRNTKWSFICALAFGRLTGILTKIRIVSVLFALLFSGAKRFLVQRTIF